MLLAFDDTDSPKGGCTTRLLLDVLAALPGWVPGGLPRLVRLNPNVPWKTRGNGAVCIELVRPEGPTTRIGEWRGMEIHASPHGKRDPPDQATLDAIWDVIRSQAQPDAQPAVALFDEAPPEALYWSGVRELVDPQDMQPMLPELSVGSPRALVGCMAAAAWRGPASSYELLVYREPSRYGTKRHVNSAALRTLDLLASFHSWDAEADRPAAIPATPCPVLLGLRGREPDALLAHGIRAVAAAAQEPVDAWLLWDTNQASGDHVTAVDSVMDAPQGSTVRLEGRVETAPTSKDGGHVHVGVVDAQDILFTAIAFEPTGSFRAHVRELLPGDQVRVTGAWNDGSVQLESFEILEAVPRKVANPAHCGRPMKSRGAWAGYKCRCGATADEAEAQWASRGTGRFEVPVMARRHLHRPLDW